MQRNATDYINHELSLLLQHNPPHRSPDPEAINLCPKLTPPLTFYDKHLDTTLILKRVEFMPLATYISRAVNLTSQSIKDKKIPLPSHHPMDSFPSEKFRAAEERDIDITITDAESLAKMYQSTIASYAAVVASTLALHFRAPGWYSAFIWKRAGAGGTESFYAFSENYALQLRDDLPKILAARLC